MKKLYWVMPCYNEEECFPVSSKIILEKLEEFIRDGLVSKDSRLVFVDDGSKDNTWQLISEFALNNKLVNAVKLSRNKGHQFAVEAGLRFAYEKEADFTITMDVDLQDDIEVVKDMIVKYHEGNEVVYGVRNDRKDDSFFKRSTANVYYRVMSKLGVEIVENSADFRLIGRNALAALLEYHEANLFLRGLVPQVGFKSEKVEYKRKKREQGKTHYPISKMLKLAFDGITGFSSKPLTIIPYIGNAIMAICGIIMLVFMILNLTKVLPYHLEQYLFPGMGFGVGFLTLIIGVVALYVDRINIEVKKRPHYFVERVIDDNK